MFGPVRKTDSQESVCYVNVTTVTYIEPGKKQRAKFDNSDWPTAWIHFSGEQIDKGLHVFGAPELILTSWFGEGQAKADPLEKPPIIPAGAAAVQHPSFKKGG